MLVVRVVGAVAIGIHWLTLRFSFDEEDAFAFACGGHGMRGISLIWAAHGVVAHLEERLVFKKKY